MTVVNIVEHLITTQHYRKNMLWWYNSNCIKMHLYFSYIMIMEVIKAAECKWLCIQRNIYWIVICLNVNEGQVFVFISLFCTGKVFPHQSELLYLLCFIWYAYLSQTPLLVWQMASCIKLVYLFQVKQNYIRNVLLFFKNLEFYVSLLPQIITGLYS